MFSNIYYHIQKFVLKYDNFSFYDIYLKLLLSIQYKLIINSINNMYTIIRKFYNDWKKPKSISLNIFTV